MSCWGVLFTGGGFNDKTGRLGGQGSGGGLYIQPTIVFARFVVSKDAGVFGRFSLRGTLWRSFGGAHGSIRGRGNKGRGV